MGPSRPVATLAERMGRSGTGAPRPASVPSVSQEEEGLRLQLTRHLAEQKALFQRLMLDVGTIDSLVYEHDTQQLNPSTNTFTNNLQPQTAQTEYIRGLFCSIVVPTLVSAPTITIVNAWAKLGGEYINLNAIINSAGGTGGMLPGHLLFILSSEASRQINLVASSNWPAGAYCTFVLFGHAVPTMDGGVLH